MPKIKVFIVFFLMTIILQSHARGQEDCDILLTDFLEKTNANSIIDNSAYAAYFKECPLEYQVNYLSLTESFNPKKKLISSNKVKNKTLAFKANSSSDVDITPPELISFSVSPQSVDVSSGQKTVSVDISLSDESGIGDNEGFWIRNRELGYIQWPTGNFPDWVLNSATGTYDATLNFVFDEKTAGGNWELESINSLEDTQGNRVWILTEDIIELGFNPIVTIVNANVTDTSPPELISFSVSPQSVDVSSGQKTVSVDISLSDESGIGDNEGFWIRNRELGYIQWPTGNFPDWVLNSATGTYDATLNFVFDEKTAGGNWELESINSLEDTQGNRVWILTEDIIKKRFNPFVSINNNSIVMDSKVKAAADYSQTLARQVSNFSLTVKESTTYQVWIIANDNTSLDSINFHGATSLAQICSTTPSETVCEFNASGISDNFSLEVTSSTLDLNFYGVSAFLQPNQSEVEQDWSSNYVYFPIADIDGDGIDNYLDTDDDGDGVDDTEDAFPLDATESVDTDNDGIGNNADTDDDGDGISDTDELINGSDPLDSNSVRGNHSSRLHKFDDVNQDGKHDWLRYEMQQENVVVSLIDGVDLSGLSVFELSHNLQSVNIITLQDRTADGTQELGVFGLNTNANRYQLLIHDGQTGQELGVWNWPVTLGEVEFVALDDLTSDGVQEYAINGIHLDNGTRQLIVKNGATKALYYIFKWPNLWDNARIVTMSDRTGDGVPEVGLYGRHTRLDKGQLFVYDGAENTKLEVYNWNKLWNDIQLIEMDDIDADGTIDWGQFGARKDDDRLQWVVKKGHTKKGVIRIFSWNGDLTDAKPMLVGDRTNDGIREVAVSGIHQDTGKLFIRINDGKSPNKRIANISWPANWEDAQLVELADLNNDGFNEFAMLGYTKTNRTVQLVIKDGKLLTEYGRYTFNGTWEDISVSSGDVNDDGIPDVSITGVNPSSLQRVAHQLSGDDLLLLEAITIN